MYAIRVIPVQCYGGHECDPGVLCRRTSPIFFGGRPWICAQYSPPDHTRTDYVYAMDLTAVSRFVPTRLRKLALVGIVLLFGRGTTAQLIVGVVMSFGFFAAHMGKCQVLELTP